MWTGLQTPHVYPIIESYVDPLPCARHNVWGYTAEDKMVFILKGLFGGRTTFNVMKCCLDLRRESRQFNVLRLCPDD